MFNQNHKYLEIFLDIVNGTKLKGGGENMELARERKNEIAALALPEFLWQQGVVISKDTKREIQNQAKRIGVSDEEALAYAKELCQGLLQRVFA